MTKHLEAIAEMSSELTSLVVGLTVVLNNIDEDKGIDAERIETMCMMYMALLDLKDQIASGSKRLNQTIESFKTKRILDRLDSMGVDKVAVPSLKRSFYPKLHHSASMADRAAGMEWLRENGGAGLITETVHHQTLTSFVREMIEDQGLEPPPEIFSFKTHRSLGSSTYTPK